MPEQGDLVQVKFVLVDTYLTFTHSDTVPWYVCAKEKDTAYPWSTSLEHGDTRYLAHAYMFDTREDAQKLADQITVRNVEIVRIVQQIEIKKTWKLDEEIKSKGRYIVNGKAIIKIVKATAL